MDEFEYEGDGIPFDYAEVDEFDGLVVSVPNGGLFPCIYNRAPKFDASMRDSYGISIPYACLPPEVAEQVLPYTPRHDPDAEPLVRLKSMHRVEVVPTTSLSQAVERGDVQSVDLKAARRTAEMKLSELVRRLGARNLSVDRLLIGRPMRAEIRGLRYGSEAFGRFVPAEVLRRVEGTFWLSVTKLWVDIEEDE